jgi:Fe2+ or Zn2+ uptake regulation protein
MRKRQVEQIRKSRELTRQRIEVTHAINDRKSIPNIYKILLSLKATISLLHLYRLLILCDKYVISCRLAYRTNVAPSSTRPNAGPKSGGKRKTMFATK